MAQKARCGICNRTFKDEEGLRAHNAAKHPELAEGHKKPEERIPIRKIRNWGIFIVILGLIGYGIFSAVAGVQACREIPVDEVNIVGHQNLAYHYHADLEIKINGQNYEIPADVGISPGVMKPVHTHDTTGELHIEGVCIRDYTLEDFFRVWGQTFSSECIFNNCADSGELRMYANGQESNEFEKHVLKDGEQILIEYVSDSSA